MDVSIIGAGLNMASIAKIQGKASPSFKAIIKQDNRILKTKSFIKTASRAWVKHIEAANEKLEAYGLLGFSVLILIC